ncbi:unnamed protein product [Euphydryas editha]|uniref:Uncharacterized protein n=1 Tax=Euphydryas editha TaxID=104508 RepID=A0AAU9UXM9_EUPED|nr:unnamed protein product [Euphydryas editha]
MYICAHIMRYSMLHCLKYPSGEDPCNPLYWYPKNIPDYCASRTTLKPLPSVNNKPFLIPPDFLSPPVPFPQMPVMPVPVPQMPIMPAPTLPGMTYGLPFPIPMLPSYHPPFRPQIGMVPGLPGIVSSDGGINIMPFSDAYADILENHKNKMIRKRLQKIINKYERRYHGYKRYYK